MKRFFILLGNIILLIGFTSCQKGDSDILLTAISQLDTVQHAEQLHDYDSPYTICYQNKDDTYSLYIFTSPIQYKIGSDAYAVIDNTVVKSQKDGFVYENKANEIKTYFPKTLEKYFRIERDRVFQEFKPSWDCNGFSEAERITYTNMYGDKISAVRYRRRDIDMVFYPTKAGIKTEIVLKEKPESNSFEFSLRTSLAWFENLQNGYILFKNGGEKESLVYQPLVQYTTEEGPQLDITAQMKIEKEEGVYRVKMILNEDILEKEVYPVKFAPSFELYINKMADTSIYSNKDVNNYLANYAVLGDHPVLGEGWHYVRSRFRYFARSLKPSYVISSAYYTYVLCGNNRDDNMTLYELDTQWSSTNLIWSEKVANGNAISDGEFRDCKLKFDITEFTKECLKDPELGKESRGFLLKSGGVKIIATSDNSEMVPFFRIDMKKLPKDFIGNQSINPPIAGFDVVY